MRGDPGCLDTPSRLVLDGANGVCGRPPSVSERLPTAGVTTTLVLVGLVVARSFARRERVRRVFGFALLGAVLAAAVPPAISLFRDRADAPAHAMQTADAVARLVHDVDAFVRKHGGCARVDHAACEACFPIVRFALPAPGRCTGDASATILLGHGALGGECVEDGDVLACGMPTETRVNARPR
jgi:hypothetical protein